MSYAVRLSYGGECGEPRPSRVVSLIRRMQVHRVGAQKHHAMFDVGIIHSHTMRCCRACVSFHDTRVVFDAAD